MAKLLVRYRYWFLSLSLAIMLVCGFLAFKVNINTDMTKYLPDDSRMRAGLEILTHEFGDMVKNHGADIRVLCKDLSESEKIDFLVQMRKLENVSGVTVQESKSHTLYELSVASHNVDLLNMKKQIAKSNDKVVTVETSQDGATAEAPMLLGAVALLLVILFAMCKSWLEPVLFLISTGVAVLMNVGTNALLPSVSATTNSIVAVLQLVLSMDYSIILINRFRQERQQLSDSAIVMERAIKQASSSIISSAFTTIVGLMMLVFMKLKIGTDLGVVLSKGVLCSLICNFTILPSLILLFEKGIDKSVKKVLQFPIDKLTAFSMKFRYVLAGLFVVIFVGSYFLHNKTDIKFLNVKESKIDRYFPKKNPVMLVYDNADEYSVVTLMDSLLHDENVEMVISYPTLLLREYTAPKMVEAIKEMSTIAANIQTEEVPNIKMDMLSEDVLKVIYYAAHSGQEEIFLSLDEMADFVMQQAYDPNSMIAKMMDEDLKSKLNMLNDVRIAAKQPLPVAPDNVEPMATYRTPVMPVSINESPVIVADDMAPSAPQEFAKPVVTLPLSSPYADTANILKPMTYSEMASFLTMDDGQAKLVYKLADRSHGTMTPHQFVHFVTETILKRRMMAAMIKNSQEKQLFAVQHTMDSALQAATMVKGTSLKNNVTTTTSDITSYLPEITTLDSTPRVVIPAPIKVNKQLSVLDKMLDPHKRFSAAEMSKNLELLGESIPEGMLNLLYLYYGGNKNYDESWTMSLEKMVNYLTDSVMTDPRFESFVDDEMRNDFAQMHNALIAGVGSLKSKDHSVALIITSLPGESEATYRFVDYQDDLCNRMLKQPYYSIGEPIMLSEMKAGFSREVLLVTFLTILAIFVIVALTFRSLLMAAILVMAVMSGVFVNVVVSGMFGGSLLYIAYLIVQSILMGAAIDYGILFANYYKENRMTADVRESLRLAYQGSIHTILTSGLILILVPAVMSFLVSDATVSDIVRSIGLGAMATVSIILFILPGLLAACDKLIIRKKKQQE